MPEFRITVATDLGQHSWLAEYESAEEAEKALRQNGQNIVEILPSPHQPATVPAAGVRHPESYDKNVLTGNEVRERRDPEMWREPQPGLRDHLAGEHPVPDGGGHRPRDRNG